MKYIICNMALTNMGKLYGHTPVRNLLLDGCTNDPTDKLSDFQRQKIDHLFHVLYGEYLLLFTVETLCDMKYASDSIAFKK